MKRLYDCVAILTKGNKIQHFSGLLTGEENEVTGYFLKNAQNKFPDYQIGSFRVDKVSMYDIMNIIENIDISESEANFIKRTLAEKGY